MADIEQQTRIPEVNWEHIFNPSEWYISAELVQENFVALVASLATVLVAFLAYTVIRAKGVDSEWYKGLKTASKFKLDDTWVYRLWSFTYVTLFASSWLVWVYGGKEWNRALTVYALHLVVNVLFAVSFYWVRDISLALLNLITLIGVAMFTSSQFNAVLHFASYILTPYLVFLLIYTVQFSYFWYLNEGKELMDIAAWKSGKVASGASAAAGKKKKEGTIPEDVKKQLQIKAKANKQAAADAKKTRSPSSPKSD